MAFRDKLENPENMAQRKAQHLDICLDESKRVETGTSYFQHLSFAHKSLPEQDAGNISLKQNFCGYECKLPIFISSMTGGSSQGFAVNKTLASLAQEAGIPVGTGSMRIVFKKPEVTEHFALKKIAPDVPVFGNLGGMQIRDMSHDAIIETCKRLEFDALAIHLNPGQEMMQDEGDRNFKGIFNALGRFRDKAPFPIIVKETGFGIAPHEAKSLKQIGIDYIDLAGKGGTNWIRVEGYRTNEDGSGSSTDFNHWGYPTAVLLAAYKELGIEGNILASGGIRSGMDVAKSIALGAQMAGFALPFVRAVTEGGVDEGLSFIANLRKSLETVLIISDSDSIASLQTKFLLKTTEFKNLLQELLEYSNQHYSNQ